MKKYTSETVDKFVEYFESPASINVLFQELASATMSNTIANDWSPGKRVNMVSALLWLNNLSCAAFSAKEVDYDELIGQFSIEYGTCEKVTELLFEILESALISEKANSWKEDKRSDIVFFTSWVFKLVSVAFTKRSFAVDKNAKS